ncbi:AsnC family transcriptional regulator [Nocardia tenerifensis]|uniref:AsnC family transcriptional regulator n=1 Tax=Nocardia tenerifensis TaxID=228006 RepID=A0A318K6D1_9NOCA|nr:Lrp/AsnC family transcriptional regulator [Nocardia tenerifensis]PXX65212.1 AsnC family transcriptional regulator [Nocardia tenerifensis]
MSAAAVSGNSILDGLDARIVQALQLDPRVSFNRVAAELGVAEQTVARRYRRLRRDGVVRVIGAVDSRAIGEHDWIIRVHCRPDGARQVAEALARRDDAAWVSIAAAGAEVNFSLHPRSPQDRDDLLVQRLQRTAPVHGIAAALILHRFVGPRALDWRGRQAARGEKGTAATDYVNGELRLRDEDGALLELLARDGRAGFSVLARATGMSIGRVARRIAALQAAGILYFDLDIAPAALGSSLSAFLWLRVAPARLDAVGRAVAQHDETDYAAAVTGPFNIFAVLTADTAEGLYHYVTTKMATLDGVHSFELTPVLERFKQAGSSTTGGRLNPPAPVPPRAARRR